MMRFLLRLCLGIRFWVLLFGVVATYFMLALPSASISISRHLTPASSSLSRGQNEDVSSREMVNSGEYGNVPQREDTPYKKPRSLDAFERTPSSLSPSRKQRSSRPSKIISTPVTHRPTLKTNGPLRDGWPISTHNNKKESTPNGPLQSVRISAPTAKTTQQHRHRSSNAVAPFPMNNYTVLSTASGLLPTQPPHHSSLQPTGSQVALSNNTAKSQSRMPWKVFLHSTIRSITTTNGTASFRHGDFISRLRTSQQRIYFPSSSSYPLSNTSLSHSNASTTPALTPNARLSISTIITSSSSNPLVSGSTNASAAQLDQVTVTVSASSQTPETTSKSRGAEDAAIAMGAAGGAIGIAGGAAGAALGAQGAAEGGAAGAAGAAGGAGAGAAAEGAGAAGEAAQGAGEAAQKAPQGNPDSPQDSPGDPQDLKPSQVPSAKESFEPTEISEKPTSFSISRTLSSEFSSSLPPTSSSEFKFSTSSSSTSNSDLLTESSTLSLQRGLSSSSTSSFRLSISSGFSASSSLSSSPGLGDSRALGAVGAVNAKPTNACPPYTWDSVPAFVESTRPTGRYISVPSGSSFDQQASSPASPGSAKPPKPPFNPLRPALSCNHYPSFEFNTSSEPLAKPDTSKLKPLSADSQDVFDEMVEEACSSQSSNTIAPEEPHLNYIQTDSGDFFKTGIVWDPRAQCSDIQRSKLQGGVAIDTDCKIVSRKVCYWKTNLLNNVGYV